MKVKYFFSLLLVVTFALCGCNVASDSEFKIEKATGRCIFDKINDPDAYVALRDSNETITVDSVPGLVIEKSEEDGELCFPWSRLGQEHYCTPFSLYISDVNFDGYDDVCVMNLKGSGVISADITIYDFHYRNIIYTLEGRSERRDFRFKIINGEFVIIDCPMASDSISRIGHFINKNDKKVNVEWEDVSSSLEE